MLEVLTRAKELQDFCARASFLVAHPAYGRDQGDAAEPLVTRFVAMIRTKRHVEREYRYYRKRREIFSHGVFFFMLVFKRTVFIDSL